jgi:hypothetical protein
MLEPSLNNQYLADHVGLMIQSFKKLTNTELLIKQSIDQDSAWELAKSLFYAPCMVVSHNTDPDPIFNYGNQTALRLFEMNWQELTSLPSRQSAAAIEQVERSLLLKTVSEQGYIDNYSGVRISKTGKRFRLQKAIVWNLIDAQGEYRGQAAVCHHWNFI